MPAATKGRQGGGLAVICGAVDESAGAPAGETSLELQVLAAEGLPEGSLLSVTAGGFQRHRLLSRCNNEPMVFRGISAAGTSSWRLDVLAPFGSSGNMGRVSSGTFRVPLRACGRAQGQDMSLSVSVAERQSCAGQASRPPTADSVKPDEASSANLSQYLAKHGLKEKLTHVLARLFREQPEDPVEFLGQGLLGFAGTRSPAARSPKVAAGGCIPLRRNTAPSQSPPTTSGNGARSAQSVNASVGPTTPLAAAQNPTVTERTLSKNTVSVHSLPSCVSTVDCFISRLMDLGSSETGFYTYQLNEEGTVLVRGNKRSSPFFECYVEPWNVEGFCEAAVSEFGLQETSTRGEVTIFAGVTGLSRELMSERQHLQKAQEFMLSASNHIADVIGRPTRVKLFVPSGLTEAQLELYATEWLVARTKLFQDAACENNNMLAALRGARESIARHVFCRLDRKGKGALDEEDVQEFLRREDIKSPTQMKETVLKALPQIVKEADLDCDGKMSMDEFYKFMEESDLLQVFVQTEAFAGTLSAGGGSCQLSMMGSSGSKSSMQLFSVPVGNRVPILEGTFSNPVTQEEQENWQRRVRRELLKANFPRGLRGLYVGISAMFYAAKAAQVADIIISKQAAVHGIEEALRTHVSRHDQRSIANLTLALELLNWVYDEDSSFVFRRNWSIGNIEYIATWTLGLYTQQLVLAKSEKKRKQNLVWSIAAKRLLPFASTSMEIARRGLQGVSSDRIFEVPFVAWPTMPSCILDIGSGEIGTYVYKADLATGSVLTLQDTKIKAPFYEYFVAKHKAQEFSEALAQRFAPLSADQEPRPQRPPRGVIAGGTTGLHREMMLGDKVKRDQIFAFIAEVERVLATRLGRDVTLRLFVPSGELEAQFELRAVQWLVSQQSVEVRAGSVIDWMLDKAFCFLCEPEELDSVFVQDRSNLNREESRREAMKELDNIRARDASRLQSIGMATAEVNEVMDSDIMNLSYEDFRSSVLSSVALQALVRRICFMGTVSAGGGSSQLALGSCARSAVSQLYSMPIGNRVPIVERLFSSPTTSEEQVDWVERIRGGLQSCNFPTGLTGLFVGISAMYHAAKAAGIADCILSKAEVMQGFGNALSNIDRNDHRSIANVTLAREIIRWAFDDEQSCFLFKRNWEAQGMTYCATWTFGWYVSQHEGDKEARERCAVHIQRLIRGHLSRMQCRPTHPFSLRSPPPSPVQHQAEDEEGR